MASLTHLKDLDKKASQSPWYQSGGDNVPRNSTGDIQWPQHLGRDLPLHWDYYLNDTDAELIVETRNALPALLEIAESARGLLNAWDEETRNRARIALNNAFQKVDEA